MLPSNEKLKSDTAMRGKPHILKSLAVPFSCNLPPFSLTKVDCALKNRQEAKIQSASKITLAQHCKMHPIKTLNSMLIILPNVPFHQGFQINLQFLHYGLDISNPDCWQSALPSLFLMCTQSSKLNWWTIFLLCGKSPRLGFSFQFLLPLFTSWWLVLQFVRRS